jgi:hypothetical protein
MEVPDIPAVLIPRRLRWTVADGSAGLCFRLSALPRLFLLAIGDTGHVGFRVLAYALGGLETIMYLVMAFLAWGRYFKA